MWKWWIWWGYPALSDTVLKHIPVISYDYFRIARIAHSSFLVEALTLGIYGRNEAVGCVSRLEWYHSHQDGSGLHRGQLNSSHLLPLPDSVFVLLMNRKLLQALGRILSLGRDSVECVPKSTRKIREITLNFKTSLSTVPSFPIFPPFPFSCYSFPTCTRKRGKIGLKKIVANICFRIPRKQLFTYLLVSKLEGLSSIQGQPLGTSITHVTTT